MYSFEFQTKYFEIKFLDFDLQSEGELAGRMSFISEDISFAPIVHFSPKDLLKLGINNVSELKIEGWGFYIIFKKTENSALFEIEFETEKNPLNQIKKPIVSYEFEFSSTCSKEDLQKFKEDLGYFLGWLKQEIENIG